MDQKSPLQMMKRDAVTLTFSEIGAGEAAPMLFVHGWCCNHSHFLPQQQHFGKTRRTVSVDLRGHGASDAPQQEYTVRGFADDLAWLCQQLNLKRPIVVGHSMGGNVALELAFRYQDLPAAIVMIDSVMFPDEHFRHEIHSLNEALSGSGYLSALERAVSSLFLPTDSPVIRSTVKASMMSSPHHVLSSAFGNHLLGHDVSAAAAACKLPVAYIGAEQIMADLPLFQRLCPQLKVGRTLGCGHFSPLLESEQINAMLEGFERSYVR